jgi:hypothetical protein
MLQFLPRVTLFLPFTSPILSYSATMTEVVEVWMLQVLHRSRELPRTIGVQVVRVYTTSSTANTQPPFESVVVDISDGSHSMAAVLSAASLEHCFQYVWHYHCATAYQCRSYG